MSHIVNCCLGTGNDVWTEVLPQASLFGGDKAISEIKIKNGKEKIREKICKDLDE